MKPIIRRVVMLLITLIVPFFLMMTAIRLLFTPLFLQLEYRAPGFPADMYGFSLQDRLYWSGISMQYLLNDSSIDFLADQRLPDGAPLYNERELSHMLDVKILVQQMLAAWRILLAVLVGLCLWSWRGKWQPDFARALSNGGKLTLGLIALILAGVAISFYELFTYFHKIFFVGDTWLFLYTDTLIRLFPLRFW
jgi:integral membrane protein (TIGR01906 family)